jgi:hypothetical protein
VERISDALDADAPLRKCEVDAISLGADSDLVLSHGSHARGAERSPDHHLEPRLGGAPLSPVEQERSKAAGAGSTLAAEGVEPPLHCRRSGEAPVQRILDRGK